MVCITVWIYLYGFEIGGTADIAGEVIKGTQNIFFYLSLATGDFSQFASTNFGQVNFFHDVWFATAAYAMYTFSGQRKQKAAGGYYSLLLCYFLTGITEPIEFTFVLVISGTMTSFMS